MLVVASVFWELHVAWSYLRTIHVGFPACSLPWFSSSTGPATSAPAKQLRQLVWYQVTSHAFRLTGRTKLHWGSINSSQSTNYSQLQHKGPSVGIDRHLLSTRALWVWATRTRAEPWATIMFSMHCPPALLCPRLEDPPVQSSAANQSQATLEGTQATRDDSWFTWIINQLSRNETVGPAISTFPRESRSVGTLIPFCKPCFIDQFLPCVPALLDVASIVNQSAPWTQSWESLNYVLACPQAANDLILAHLPLPIYARVAN